MRLFTSPGEVAVVGVLGDLWHPSKTFPTILNPLSFPRESVCRPYPRHNKSYVNTWEMEHGSHDGRLPPLCVRDGSFSSGLYISHVACTVRNSICRLDSLPQTRNVETLCPGLQLGSNVFSVGSVFLKFVGRVSGSRCTTSTLDCKFGSVRSYQRTRS